MIFYQVNNLFLHQSHLKKPTPSQINLIKNAKNHFLLLKKLKNTESAQPGQMNFGHASPYVASL